MCGSAGEFRYSAGGLDDASRGLPPRGIIDRPKGYPRGPARRDGVAAMPADPNTTRTNLGSDSVWQIAVPETWLQERGI